MQIPSRLRQSYPSEALPNRRQATVVPSEVRELGRRNGLLRRSSSRERHASLGNKGPRLGHGSGK